MAAVAADGAWKLRAPVAETGRVTVGLVQASIQQEDKWDPALRDVITSRYLSMTREAIAAGASFIIWPESSTPFYFESDIVRGAEIRRLARENNFVLV